MRYFANTKEQKWAVCVFDRATNKELFVVIN